MVTRSRLQKNKRKRQLITTVGSVPSSYLCKADKTAIIKSLKE